MTFISDFNPNSGFDIVEIVAFPFECAQNIMMTDQIATSEEVSKGDSPSPLLIRKFGQIDASVQSHQPNDSREGLYLAQRIGISSLRVHSIGILKSDVIKDLNASNYAICR